jgi:transposase
MNIQTHSDLVPPTKQSRAALKIGIDAHADQFVIATQIDQAAPKPPQRFDQAGLLKWIAKKLAEGYAVITCYEAGPFGYVLHRQLTEMGATNYVIRPRNWDEHHRRVKTDRRDARAMLGALDRYVAGNPHALCLVRVPTVEQERRRSVSRIQQSVQTQLKAAAQRGRGLALQYGYQLKGDWFGPRRWPSLALPAWLKELLEPLRQIALFLKQKLQEQNRSLEEQNAGPRPHGMGVLSQQLLEREVGDWSRFRNRRQVSSYLGLCPSEHSSGNSQQKGRITKAGNGRMRRVLCQLGWTLLRYQPHYRLVQKWSGPMSQAGRSRRKQILIALIRGFAVDWWRLRTGQTTPAKLGLQMAV